MFLGAQGLDWTSGVARYAKDKSLPDPASTSNPEFKCVLSLIRESIQKDPMKWTKMGTPSALTASISCICIRHDGMESDGWCDVSSGALYFQTRRAAEMDCRRALRA